MNQNWIASVLNISSHFEEYIAYVCAYHFGCSSADGNSNLNVFIFAINFFSSHSRYSTEFK